MVKFNAAPGKGSGAPWYLLYIYISRKLPHRLDKPNEQYCCWWWQWLDAIMQMSQQRRVLGSSCWCGCGCGCGCGGGCWWWWRWSSGGCHRLKNLHANDTCPAFTIALRIIEQRMLGASARDCIIFNPWGVYYLSSVDPQSFTNIFCSLN